MSDSVRCQMCSDGVLVRGPGRLEQSGATYLPTTVWSCALCGFARYEAALGTAWRAAEPPGGEADPLRLPVRRAA